MHFLLDAFFHHVRVPFIIILCTSSTFASLVCSSTTFLRVYNCFRTDVMGFQSKHMPNARNECKRRCARGAKSTQHLHIKVPFVLKLNSFEKKRRTKFEISTQHILTLAALREKLTSLVTIA